MKSRKNNRIVWEIYRQRLNGRRDGGSLAGEQTMGPDADKKAVQGNSP
ncbi:MAG: hypothetical protein ACOX5Z_10135 [Desulfobulbus sp.]